MIMSLAVHTYPKNASSTHSMLVVCDGPSSAASKIPVYDSVNTSHAPNVMASTPSMYDFITKPTLQRGLFWLTIVPTHCTTEHCCAA